MSRSRPALVRLSKDFIKGYCALVEGEKDPRNLMLSFGIIHIILVEFDLTDCVEVSSLGLDMSDFRIDELTLDRVT